MKIVVDTSALAAILFDEEERDLFESVLIRNEPHISAGSAVEFVRVVHTAMGANWVERARAFLSAYAIKIMPIDHEQVDLAQDGMLRFGKGRRSAPAVLNFGDLFAYALARQLSAPLLFKGADFTQTDIVPAVTA